MVEKELHPVSQTWEASDKELIADTGGSRYDWSISHMPDAFFHTEKPGARHVLLLALTTT